METSSRPAPRSSSPTLSISEVAERFGVSLETIRRWEKAGLIKSIRPDGKNRVFLLRDVEALAARQPLTAGAAAQFLGISAGELKRLTETGTITSTGKNGATHIYTLSNLKNFKNHLSSLSNAPERPAPRSLQGEVGPIPDFFPPPLHATHFARHSNSSGGPASRTQAGMSRLIIFLLALALLLIILTRQSNLALGITVTLLATLISLIALKKYLPQTNTLGTLLFPGPSATFAQNALKGTSGEVLISYQNWSILHKRLRTSIFIITIASIGTLLGLKVLPIPTAVLSAPVVSVAALAGLYALYSLLTLAPKGDRLSAVKALVRTDPRIAFARYAPIEDSGALKVGYSTYKRLYRATTFSLTALILLVALGLGREIYLARINADQNFRAATAQFGIVLDSLTAGQSTLKEEIGKLAAQSLQPAPTIDEDSLTQRILDSVTANLPEPPRQIERTETRTVVERTTVQDSTLTAIQLEGDGKFVVKDKTGTTFVTFGPDSAVSFGDASVFTTQTLNSLDSIDGTTEGTLESALDIAGDISGTGLSDVAIGADKVRESHLKVVDSPSDEECLSYESTGGDFEWQTCGGGGFTSFTLSDGANTQTIADGNTVTVAAGADIDTTVSATDTVTIALESTLDSVAIINLAGTGTLNGLDAIDATSEATLEAALDIAGDISGTGLAAVTIGADKVLESHLKVVDAAVDEECLTFESTAGDFEWQTCDVLGSSIAASEVEDDTLDFAQFQDTLDLDAATNINVGANLFSIDLDSTGDFNIRDGTTTFVRFEDDSTIDVTLPAAGIVNIDGGSTANTNLAGVFAVQAWSATASHKGFHLNYISNDGVTADADLFAAHIDLTQNDADGDLFGLQIRSQASTNAAANSFECLLCLTNAENTSGTLINAIRISDTSFTAGAIATAINIDSSNVTTDIELQNDETISNNTDGTIALTATSVTVSGDLTISGDDLVMATNTSGAILVADGINFNPVAMSGDITINSAGATAIGADKVLESHLKAVDAAVDEECLTYETTSGDFEWQACGSGGAGTLQQSYDADADGLDAIIALTTADDSLEIDNPVSLGTDSAFAFKIDQNASGVVALQVEASNTAADAVDISAAALTTGRALDIPDLDVLTTGKGLNVASGSEAVSSGELLTLALTSSGSSNTAKTGALASIAASRTDTRTTGTTAEDFDLLSLSRTNIQNGAGGTTTAAGSVLRIENVATQTAGTLTDTVAVLELVQDADSTGAVITASNGTNNTLEMKNLSTNFGAALNAGAFIDRNSYMNWEFIKDSGDLALGDLPSGNAGLPGDNNIGLYDSGAACAYSIVDDAVNGILELKATAANIGCSAIVDSDLNNPSKIVDADNLPVILMKVKPSQADATSGVYVGIGDATDAGVSGFPANFIGFSNNNAGTLGTTWQAVTRSASVSTTVTCASQTVSTTQFALLMIEARSASNVRFFIDPDVSNGVSFTECGSGSSANIPTVVLGPQMHWQELTGGTANTTLQIDFFRAWQDDAPASQAASAQSIEVKKIEADIARSSSLVQPYPAADPGLPSGTLVALDAENGLVRPANSLGEGTLLGVVVRDGSFGLRSDALTSAVPVAIGGRTRVRVSSENGDIQPGDYVTASNIPGVAIKATRSGQVLGMALERPLPAKKGYAGQTVAVAINPQFWAGGILPQLGAGAESIGEFDSLSLSDLLVDGQSFAEQEARIMGLEARLENSESRIENTELRIDELESLSPASPREAERSGDKGTQGGVSSDNDDPENPLESPLSGGTDDGTSLDSIFEILNSADLDINSLVIRTDATIYGTLLADTIETATAFVTHGDATIWGNLLVKGDVELEGSLSVSSNQAGFAIIPAGATEVHIPFNAVFVARPVITATPQDLTNNTTWSVVDSSAEGFTIRLLSPALNDVTFAWSALAVRDAVTIRGQVPEIIHEIATPDPAATNTTPSESTDASTPLPTASPLPTVTTENPTPTPFSTEPETFPTPLALQPGQ